MTHDHVAGRRLVPPGQFLATVLCTHDTGGSVPRVPPALRGASFFGTWELGAASRPPIAIYRRRLGHVTSTRGELRPSPAERRDGTTITRAQQLIAAGSGSAVSSRRLLGSAAGRRWQSQ